MWDRAAACFHADKKPPDSCGRGSSGCGRTVLNFKRVRALPAWNGSRMDGASALRMESEPQKRSCSRSAGRPTPRPVRMESGRPFWRSWGSRSRPGSRRIADGKWTGRNRFSRRPKGNRSRISPSAWQTKRSRANCSSPNMVWKAARFIGSGRRCAR